MKVVDAFREFTVSAYCTPGHLKLLLLQKLANAGVGGGARAGSRLDGETVRLFFVDVHELLVKTLLNPLYEPNTLILSQRFDQKVKAAARKHLNPLAASGQLNPEQHAAETHPGGSRATQADKNAKNNRRPNTPQTMLFTYQGTHQ
eukprot:GHVT01091141.1.p1 GENE.GHVT01091141.1~~GHVT01091141.1.p1  ORF type:complete len:146 (-),score=32.21 GHVT01091141.1:608-1045(-)